MSTKLSYDGMSLQKGLKNVSLKNYYTFQNYNFKTTVKNRSMHQVAVSNFSHTLDTTLLLIVPTNQKFIYMIPVKSTRELKKVEVSENQVICTPFADIVSVFI